MIYELLPCAVLSAFECFFLAGLIIWKAIEMDNKSDLKLRRFNEND